MTTIMQWSYAMKHEKLLTEIKALYNAAPEKSPYQPYKLALGYRLCGRVNLVWLIWQKGHWTIYDGKTKTPLSQCYFDCLMYLYDNLISDFTLILGSCQYRIIATAYTDRDKPPPAIPTGSLTNLL